MGNKIIRSAPNEEQVNGGLTTYETLNTRVIVLKLTPELNPSIFYLLKNDYDAIVLEPLVLAASPHTTALTKKLLPIGLRLVAP